MNHWLQVMTEWQDLIGATVGGLLAFAAAGTILYAERAHARFVAMRQVAAAIRAYRGAAVPLLTETLPDPDKPPKFGQILATLRLGPTLSPAFDQTAALLLSHDIALSGLIVRFSQLAATAANMRAHIADNVRLLKEQPAIDSREADSLSRELAADILSYRTAVDGANREGQAIQRYLTKYHFHPGAWRRRLARSLKDLFTFGPPAGVVVTKEWDVLPTEMVERVRRASGDSGRDAP